MRNLLLVFFLLFSISSSAEDISWETGTLNGWTVGGGSIATVKSTGWSPNGIGVAVSGGVTNYSPGGGKTWTINPYGNYMGSLQPGSGAVTFDSATSSLGLTGTENTAIKTYLSYQSTHGGGGNPTPTNATWIKQTVALTAGTTYSIAWNYLSTDYTPWNDGSMITLTHATNASVTPTLNNKQQRYGLLGFTNPGTGEYATGSYGSTGWQVAVFTVPEDGNYVLGFASFNLGDTSLSPILFVDQLQGSTSLNGQTFGPVAPNPGSTAPTAPVSGNTLCCGGSADPFTIDTDKTTSLNAFINRTTQDSKVYVDQIGNNNTITIQQTGTKNNYAEYNGNGSSNTINITQSGNSTTTANYVELNVNGNNNAVDLTQSSTGGTKSIFATITDNSNDVSIVQSDNSNHHVDLTLSGGSKNVDISQSGSGGHRADITLTGVGSRNLSLTQTGSAQQFYSINSNCASSCQAITVTQGQ